MRRHFSSSRRTRRATLPLEEFQTPRRVTHLHLSFPISAKDRPARDNRPLGTEIAELRARLLRMIIENESTRRATKSYR